MMIEGDIWEELRQLTVKYEGMIARIGLKNDLEDAEYLLWEESDEVVYAHEESIDGPGLAWFVHPPGWNSRHVVFWHLRYGEDKGRWHVVKGQDTEEFETAEEAFCSTVDPLELLAFVGVNDEPEQGRV